MAGPLGSGSPHDPKSWANVAPGWRKSHASAVRLLARLVAPESVSVWDLVPLLLSSKYPAMKRNLNYMKLAVYEMAYDQVMFIDLDVIVVGDLRPFFGHPESLVGYRTCTAPVNSGFFVVTPKESHLKALDNTVLRNKCPCKQDRAPFGDSGYDDRGSIKSQLKQLWGAHLCSSVVSRDHRTWQFAGAGTGQGLMYYYFGLKLNSYKSFTYSQLPIVHYNSPGPKPWSNYATPASPEPELRQHCDFVWWRAFVSWRRRQRIASQVNASKFAFCDELLVANLHHKRSKRHFHSPSCCRTCPGGGHFASSAACNDTTRIDDYARNMCRPAAQLLRSI